MAIAVGLVVTGLAVVLSFVWIDRPVAMFFDALFGRPEVLEIGTWGLFIPFVALAVASLVVAKARGLADRHARHRPRAGLSQCRHLRGDQSCSSSCSAGRGR